MKVMWFSQIVAAGLVLFCTHSVWALNGGTPLRVVGQNDWTVAELYSLNDDISAIADTGYQQRGDIWSAKSPPKPRGESLDSSTFGAARPGR